MNYFEEFFVCPFCHKPLVRRSVLRFYDHDNDRCEYCRENIAAALAEATAIADGTSKDITVDQLIRFIGFMQAGGIS